VRDFPGEAKEWMQTQDWISSNKCEAFYRKQMKFNKLRQQPVFERYELGRYNDLLCLQNNQLFLKYGRHPHIEEWRATKGRRFEPLIKYKDGMQHPHVLAPGSHFFSTLCIEKQTVGRNEQLILTQNLNGEKIAVDTLCGDEDITRFFIKDSILCLFVRSSTDSRSHPHSSRMGTEFALIYEQGDSGEIKQKISIKLDLNGAKQVCIDKEGNICATSFQISNSDGKRIDIWKKGENGAYERSGIDTHSYISCLHISGDVLFSGEKDQDDNYSVIIRKLDQEKTVLQELKMQHRLVSLATADDLLFVGWKKNISIYQLIGDQYTFVQTIQAFSKFSRHDIGEIVCDNHSLIFADRYNFQPLQVINYGKLTSAQNYLEYTLQLIDDYSEQLNIRPHYLQQVGISSKEDLELLGIVDNTTEKLEQILQKIQNVNPQMHGAEKHKFIQGIKNEILTILNENVEHTKKVVPLFDDAKFKVILVALDKLLSPSCKLGTLHQNIAPLFAQIKGAEKDRLICMLKGYLFQNRFLEVWQNHFDNGIYSLSDLQNLDPNLTQESFYQKGL
jgi:hypothetical protein